MIALILTGHGRIASGMSEAIAQVFGEQVQLLAVDFPDGNSTAVLDASLRQAMQAVDQGMAWCLSPICWADRLFALPPRSPQSAAILRWSPG